MYTSPPPLAKEFQTRRGGEEEEEEDEITKRGRGEREEREERTQPKLSESSAYNLNSLDGDSGKTRGRHGVWHSNDVGVSQASTPGNMHAPSYEPNCTEPLPPKPSLKCWRPNICPALHTALDASACGASYASTPASACLFQLQTNQQANILLLPSHHQHRCERWRGQLDSPVALVSSSVREGCPPRTLQTILLCPNVTRLYHHHHF